MFSLKSEYKSVAHFIARRVSDLGKVKNYLASHEAQIGAAIDKGAKIAEVGATLAGHPELAATVELIDNAGKALLGKAFEVVSSLDAAAQAKGVNVPLDAAAIAQLKDLFAQVEKVLPGSTQAPAGLPLETASK